MKKILLAAAIFAVASFNSFGAACMSSGTIAQFAAAGACTIGASNQWQLSNFLVFESLAGGFGRNLNDTDLVLTLANVGSTGFSTTYTIAQNSPNFMNVNPTPAPAQTANWSNGIWITGLAGNTSDDITAVTNDLIGANGGANVTLRKVIQNQLGATQAVPTTFYNATAGTDLTETAIQAFGDHLSVNDKIALDAGGAGSPGGISAYRNTYMAAADQSGVPEPMSLVLMGAGLVGIAALRRRKC